MALVARRCSPRRSLKAARALNRLLRVACMRSCALFLKLLLALATVSLLLFFFLLEDIFSLAWRAGGRGGGGQCQGGREGRKEESEESSVYGGKDYLGELREQAEDVCFLLLVIEVAVAQQAAFSSEPEAASKSAHAQARGHLGQLAQRHS